MEHSGEYSQLSLAKRLRTARSNKNISLQSISKESCVCQRYLEAIETGEFNKLPEAAFAIGFVRSYAKAVGEDVDEIAAAFKSVYCSGGTDKEREACESEMEVGIPSHSKFDRIKQIRKKPTWLAPFTGIFGVLIVVIWFGSAGDVFLAEGDDGDGSLADLKDLRAVQAGLLLSDVLAEAALSENNPSSDYSNPDTISLDFENSPTGLIDKIAPTNIDDWAEDTPLNRGLPALLPAVLADDQSLPIGVRTVTLVGKRDSWVRINRKDGREIWSGILSAGETFTPDGEPGMTITLSDAGAVQLENGRKTVRYLGLDGEIVKNLTLE